MVTCFCQKGKHFCNVLHSIRSTCFVRFFFLNKQDSDSFNCYTFIHLHLQKSSQKYKNPRKNIAGIPHTELQNMFAVALFWCCRALFI